jgi:drug/metabolite transporter (DMT)-like permease
MDLRSLLLLGGTALSWGSSFLLIAVAVRSVEPLHVSFIRLSLGAVVLWLVLGSIRALRNEPTSEGRVTTRRHVVGIVLGGALLAVPFTLIGIGEREIDSGIAGIVNATVPLWAVVLSLALGANEVVTWGRIAGLGVGFIGVLSLMTARIAGDAAGAASAGSYLILLIAAACYALLAVATRLLLSDVSPTRIAAWTCLIPALLLAPFVGGSLSENVYGRDQVISLLLLGVVATGGGMFLYYQLLARVGPVRAATVNYLLPVLAVSYGAVLLGERFLWTDIAGLMLVLIGVWIVGQTGRAARGREVGAGE